MAIIHEEEMKRFHTQLCSSQDLLYQQHCSSDFLKPVLSSHDIHWSDRSLKIQTVRKFQSLIINFNNKKSSQELHKPLLTFLEQKRSHKPPMKYSTMPKTREFSINLMKPTLLQVVLKLS